MATANDLLARAIDETKHLHKVYRVCVLLSIYNLLSNVKSVASIHSKLKLRFYGISYFIVNWDAIHLNPM